MIFPNSGHMNRILYLLILLVSISGGLKAQPEFRLGLKGGMNISTFRSQELTTGYVTAGYHAGLFARIPLAGALSVQPEVQYSVKGSTFNEALGNYFSKASLSLEYVDAIGLLDLQFAKVMHLQGGLVLGFLTDYGIKNKSDDPENINLEENMQQDDLRFFDPGYALGIEVDLMRFNAGFRYTHGIRNISDEIQYQGQPLSFPELRNTVYQVYLGIRII